MTATIVVNERGHLYVESIPHTCNEWTTKPCKACDTLAEYWESFIEEDDDTEAVEAFEAWLDRQAS